jgi:thioredoxin 1
MSEFFEVTADTFAQKVTQADLPVLLEFSAPWCNPCKRLEPVLEELGREWKGKVLLARVNVDENPELAMKHQVMSVPTVILMTPGKEVARLTGLQSRERIVERFSSHL